ncbi:MAG: hypothetical protein K9N51_00920 [Candidatus Pacebacteria bacterium]|nr:hypothetical protein [Candidatus Paceibacterota bacterium]
MHKLFLPGEITERLNCCDRIEPLRKHPANPLLVADRPWESHVLFPCVLRDAATGTFRMWYQAVKTMADRHNPAAPMVDNWEPQHAMYLCYAESADGLAWSKPEINRLKVKEYGPNNIVVVDSGFIGGQGTVIEDDTDPDPARRFKLMIYDNDGKGRDGIRTAVSPDGLDWTFVGPFPFLPSQDTPSLWHDRRRGRYVAFLKTRLDGKRARTISVSEDFENWSEPRVLLAPDLADAPTVEFYAQHAFHHWGHDLALLTRYDLSVQHLDLELITSADGISWRRLPTRPCLLRPGEWGAWDCGGVFSGIGHVLDVGGESGIYYAGTQRRHDPLLPLPHEPADSGIGLATFAPGRLAGQQFTGDGWCQTIPFRCPGGRLTLNAVAHKPMTVEIHSAGYGGSLAGFTRDACEPVSGDSQTHAVSWNEHATLDALRDRFILLRVYGSKGVVFGFEIQDR